MFESMMAIFGGVLGRGLNSLERGEASPYPHYSKPWEGGWFGKRGERLLPTPTTVNPGRGVGLARGGRDFSLPPLQ